MLLAPRNISRTSMFPLTFNDHVRIFTIFFDVVVDVETDASVTVLINTWVYMQTYSRFLDSRTNTHL